jgi:polysaccharide export outer membrane protein
MPFLFSCVGYKEAINFNIQNDVVTQIQYPNTESVIQKNDLLSILVTSKSPEASQIYNLPTNSSRVVSNTEVNGYLVNEDSTIQFPGIGTLKAAGLTKTQLKDTITWILNDRKLLLDPIVSVRNLNFKVTVLGEVTRPTVVNVPSEKINMLEALGFAGDMTIFANRKNVLLIREEGGRRTFEVMNMNSNEIFSSPFFYLKPNDIIYVQPNKTKISNVSALRSWLPVIFSTISLASVIVWRATR